MSPSSFLNPEHIALSTDGVEYHPLQPFLGSFPPQRKRWCMDFYYPNFINDHWRIEGLIFFGDKDHFVDTAAKTFRLDLIIPFLMDKGIGFYDTSTAVLRLKDNASDKFLEVVLPTDIHALLSRIPHCRVIVTTGEKATATLCHPSPYPKCPQWAGMCPFQASMPTDSRWYSTVCPPLHGHIPFPCTRKPRHTARCSVSAEWSREQPVQNIATGDVNCYGKV